MLRCRDRPLSANSDQRTAANSNHIHGTHVPVEEPSTASKAEINPRRRWYKVPGVACEPRDALISACIFPNQEASHADRNRY